MTAPMPLEDFTDDQARRLAAIEAAQEAPESYDAVAVLRRVEALAEHWGADTDARYSASRIAKSTAARVLRDALAGTT